MLTKKYISQELETAPNWCSVEEAIKELQKLQVKYKDYKDLRLETTSIPYSDSDKVTIMGNRLETDEELNRRIDAENQSKEWRKKQYEALKKEFENLDDFVVDGLPLQPGGM